MRIVVVRDSRPDCASACGEWVSAQGEFVRETPGLFRKLFRDLGQRDLPIFIASSGGDVEAALQVGRLFRARRVTVAVQRTRFADCAPGKPACPAPKSGEPVRGEPDTGMSNCASACVYALAGAERRILGAASAVGVHQSRSVARIHRRYYVRFMIENGRRREISRRLISEKTVAIKPEDQGAGADTYKPIARYLREMGISDGLLALATAVPPSSIRALDWNEVVSTRLMTEYRSPASLVRPRTQETVESFVAMPAAVVSANRGARGTDPLPVMLNIAFAVDGEAWNAAGWAAQIMAADGRNDRSGLVVTLRTNGSDVSTSQPSDDPVANKDGLVVGALGRKDLCGMTGPASRLTIRVEYFDAAKAAVEARIARNVSLPALAELRDRACRT
ncbi:hypothetical protein [Prosthecodimorpha staleyi]|uniref:Uncharacterized protein n=1 Tax=Prosthecodimorpha staleyi TaxID=2840188 RepID=A0A947GDM6_9HYPH|nr:hypothetical protein [Prosthecodimorpha staleyi]MBT9292728.1 hypothetical protein [Prosthecodimorpha staleyi]